MMSRFASSGLVPEKWETIAPFYEALQKETVTPDNMEGWLKQWSDLHIVLEDAIFAAYRAVSENTADAEAEQKYMHFVEEIQPKVATAEQLLAEKMLDISDSAIPESKMEAVRRLKNWAALYNEKNLAINTEIAKLGNEYDKTVGAMTVAIDGKEQTMQQAGEHQFNVDRNHREKAWHIVQERWLIDRAVLDQLFLEMLALRREIAGNAGFSDFRDYKWRNLSRFTYTPQDCLALHEAIEQEVIPVVRKYTTRKAAQMSIKTLRPWDSNVDALGRKALRPFETVAQLEDGIQRIFNRIDPVLGSHFNRMRDGNLDLESRRNKAPGAYCGGFHQTGKPYIFANVIGVHDDVVTLLHESGHAFHFLESAHLDTIWDKGGMEAVNYEFGEVASMAMELLAAPYIEKEQGGFYEADEARRARSEHLLSIIKFLPYMSVVDSFQHWVYAEAPVQVSAAECDAKWGELWDRFMGWEDWSGLDNEKVSGWHRKLHIFHSPFYYIEYGLAQLGALQIWRNALQDHAKALSQYRYALSLGNTKPLPELYQAAGARLAFDRATVAELMQLVDQQLEKTL